MTEAESVMKINLIYLMSYPETGSSRMRRANSAPYGNLNQPDNGGQPQGNPEIWVQLGAEGRNADSTLMRTVQELKDEMARLRADNARLNIEQERILKSLSDKQHQKQSHPRPEQAQITDEMSYHTEQEEAEDRGETRGEKSVNASEYQTPKRPRMELQGEFRKIKPPHFDGESEEAAEAWLINMNKYFQVYEYDHHLKARLAIFQLQAKATLWWEEVKMVRGVSEQDVTWEMFQRYFKEKYLTERFYDEKAREFHDLRLGQQTIDEFVTKFTSLLRYVPYIREEKAKVQRFVSNLPLTMRERIEFDNPKTMDEAIRKARLCYQKNKSKGENSGKRWTDKRGSKMPMGSKGARNSFQKGFSKGANTKNPTKNQNRFKPPAESKYSEQQVRLDNEGSARPPVQCWGCGGPHYVRNCPHRKDND